MKKNPTKRLCSELIVDFLVGKKITHVFDLSGGMIAYLEEAISRKKGIECVPMHHEQAAGFAAEGYARKGQNFGVAMATSGPGATNLITAIGSSYFDSIPTMFIVGQVHTDNIKKDEHIRQEGFQETDIVKVITPLTKYAAIVRNPRRIIYELEKAYFLMKNGRPGSVLIDVPINIQRTEINENEIEHFLNSKEHKLLQKEQLAPPSNKEQRKKIAELSNLLKRSKAPIVLVGNGVRLSETKDELAAFIERNNLPVITSLMGIDSFPHSKQLVGYIGSNGNRDANIIFANADLIIALGTRLDIRQTGDPRFFNEGVILVHVDVEESVINYSIPSKISFVTDLKSFFKSAEKVVTGPKLDWLRFISTIQKEFSRPLVYSPNKLDPNTFISELSRLAKDKSVIVADVGQNQMWCAQSWKAKKGHRLLFSGGMGAMGFALPAAIGSWFADKKAQQIVICGDGGLQINIQEMETVSRNKIPLKMFIFNNKSLGMVREFQDLYFNKNYQSTVVGYGCPNLKKIAYAYDFDYIRVTKVSSNDVKIKNILDSKKPVLVEVDIDMTAPLQPKIVYGHRLDDQAPYLSDEKKAKLEMLKAKLFSSKSIVA